MYVHDFPDSDRNEYHKDSEKYANQPWIRSRESWCTPLDLELIREVYPTWASEMMRSIKLPAIPEFIQLQRNLSNSVGRSNLELELEMAKILSDDTVIVNEFQPDKEQKVSNARKSLNRTESEDREEIRWKPELFEEKSSWWSKPSSTTSSYLTSCSKQSKPSSITSAYSTPCSEQSMASSTISAYSTPCSEQSMAWSSNNSEQSSTEPIFIYDNLLVNYLPPDMDSTVLRSLFASHGTIVRCKVVYDRASGISKGYGFVKFSSAEDGIKAQKALDQYQIGRKTLKVSFSRQQRSGKKTDQKTNLFLSNLDPRMENDDLERHFKTCGYVVQCKVLKNAEGISKQIGFLRYSEAESALRAIDKFDGQQLEGTNRRIRVRIAGSPRASLNSGSSLPHSPPLVNSASSACYVAGFPATISEKRLRKVFGPFGGKKSEEYPNYQTAKVTICIH